MKTILVVIILIAVGTAVGYFGIPILIEKENAVLKTDMADLKQRLQKIEDESKASPLEPDARIHNVIRTVNALYAKTESLEKSMKENVSKADKTIEDQKSSLEGNMKKLKEDVDTINKDTKSAVQNIMFDASMANIRGHILKARADIQHKNIGTAKTELDFISEAFEKVKTTASDENKKIIEELQGILKKAKTEIDNDLPAAMNRIDLLWHEMGKLLRDA
jgi:DNA repair exonuclease SbcCD ATPase subunit